MKYIGIIDTDKFKDFEFLEDAEGKFLIAKDKKATYDEWIPLYFEPLDQQNEGHWIKVNDDVNKIHYKECSCCSVKISFNLPFLDYCPNCGAKMESEEKS